MDNFIAIDVETANNEPTSICAIGAVKVHDGAIVDRFYSLVKLSQTGIYVIFRKAYTVYAAVTLILPVRLTAYGKRCAVSSVLMPTI